MAKNVRYVVMFVRSQGREQSHVLGDLMDAYDAPFTLGRDPSCDIIIDHPSVELRAAEFSAASNHRFVKTSQDAQRRRRESWDVQAGEFEVQLVALIDLSTRVFRDEGFPVRFGPRGLGIALDQVPIDERQIEAHRIASSLRDPSWHVRELDDATRAWCTERLAAHFAALSWVEGHPVSPGQIEYTSSLDEARARANQLWSAAEQHPFRYATWSHVHRADRWHRRLRERRIVDLDYAKTFARPIVGAVPHEPLRGVVEAAASAHLATLEDDVSPARPIAHLIARGIYPLALPGGAMLLYVSSAAGSIAHSSDPAESELITALARDGVALGMRVDYAYGHARWLLAYDERMPAQPPLVLEPASPPAHLDIRGHAHPLAVVTGISCVRGEWLVGRALAADCDAVISYAGGVLWLAASRPHSNAGFNDRFVLDGTRYALFDGDVISSGHSDPLVVRCAELERGAR